MAATGGREQAGWGAAVALGAAVLLLSVLNPFPLVALPLAVCAVALAPFRFRLVALGAGLLALVFALFPAPDGVEAMARGWALGVGGLFALVAAFRPRWSFAARGLAALALAFVAAAAWLAGTDAWRGLDWMMLEQFRATSLLATGTLAASMPDSAWMTQLVAAARGYAELQGRLFPALIALQTLAGLGLAWWAYVRLAVGSGVRRRGLRPLRQFRFNDQLVWLVIIGLLLMLLPLGAFAVRAGLNLLVFMGSLYALRGVAVFLFVAGRAPSALSMVFGALFTIFFYPLILPAALLIGLGDTWLDLRERASAAQRV